MDIFEWQEIYVKQAHVYKVSDLNSAEAAEKILADFTQALAGKQITLWGAGTVGRGFYVLLRELGIPVTYVVDKRGEAVVFPDGIKVLSGRDPMIKEKVQGTLIIATVNRKIYEDICQDITAQGIGLDNVVCGHDIHMVAQQAFCMRKACTPGEKIKIKNCYECTNLDNTCQSLNQYLKRINGFVDEGKGTKAVKMIGYALSNICTLRCRCCCESVPYMPADIRYFVPAENVIRDIKKLSGACNFLTLLEFIGGEPFLHPALPEILSEALKIKNIGSVHIFTNGTVPPSDELCKVLQNERITVYLSNYQATLADHFLKKVEETERKLKEYDVNCFFGKKQNWMDFSQYDLVNSDDELKQVFEDCFLHNCNRLQDGTLYVCAHQYAGIKLGKLESKGETIAIHDYTEEELEHKLEEMKSWETIDACRYCTMPYKAETVLSGEQLEKDTE